jgi:glutathione S-transferase
LARPDQVASAYARSLRWHLPISHYSEKVRWALDWKRVPHRRRIMPPGLHPLGGLLLTGGQAYTMPVLVADGKRIGDSTEEARGKLLAALDRLEAELDRDHLVGDRFSVADLTAAALFYPLVLPDEGPWQPIRTRAFLEFQDSVRDRPGFRWVEETFRRHRHDTGV